MSMRDERIADAVRIHHIASYWYAHGVNDALARGNPVLVNGRPAGMGDPDRFGNQQGIAAREFHEGRTSYLPSIQDAWQTHVLDEVDALRDLESLLDLEERLNGR